MSPSLAQAMRGRRSRLLLLVGALLLLLVCLQLGVGSPASGSTAATAGGASAAASQPASVGGAKAKTKPAGWKAFSKRTGEFGDTGLNGPLWQMIGMVVVIAVLGAGGFWLVRRFGPKIQQRRGRHIAVIETACLGPNKNVHLLRVGDRDLLISSTREHVSMLADVTGAAGESFENAMSREGVQ